MIPNATTIERKGDLGGTEVALTLDEESVEHLMGVLTDLYSDPILAVVRETSQNAYDSHVAAGVNIPIEVRTPTAMYPYFSVQDFGLGLSPQELIDVCSKYGASTKRGTNSQVGMLGFGFKSPLAYTPQFTVVAIKNGMKSTVNIGRNSDGSGFLNIIDVSETNDRNGVLVKVPAGTNDGFLSTCLSFFQYWDEGLVTVNGEKVTSFKGTKVTDRIYISGNNHDVIVMGGIPYAVDHDNSIISDGYYRSAAVVAYVEIGAVSFTPNRERLRYDEKTLNAINELKEEFFDAINDSIQKSLDDATTASEAFVAYTQVHNDWSNIPNLSIKPTWGGEEIPFRKVIPFSHTFYNQDAYRYQVQVNGRVDTALFERGYVAFIVNYDGVSVSTNYKRKITKYCRDNGLKESKFIITSEMVPDWFSHIPVIDWADIKNVKLSYNQGVRKKPSIKVFSGGQFVESSIESDTIAFMSPSEKWWMDHILNAKNVLPGYEIASVPKNRWGSFVRNFPDAVHISTAVDEAWSAFKEGLTEDDKRAIIMESWTSRDLRRLNPDKIDDQDVVNLIRIAKLQESSREVINRLDEFKWLNKSIDLSNFKMENVIGLRYPMLTIGHKHQYIYMNAVYAAESQGE